MRATHIAAAVTLLWTGPSLSGWADQDYSDPRQIVQERERLLTLFEEQGEEAMDEFIAGLDHEVAMLRRTAAHLLVRLGEPGLPGIDQALENDDFQVRRIAMHGLAEQGLFADYWGILLQEQNPSLKREIRLVFFEDHILADEESFDKALDKMIEVYREGDPPLRMHVTEMVTSIEPLPRAARRFLWEASKDEDPDIQALAFRVVIEPTIEEMRELASEGEWEALIAEYGEEDFTEWPETAMREIGANQQASEASEAAYLRGRAYRQLGDGEKARADLVFALERDESPGSGRYPAALVNLLGLTHRDLLEDQRGAVEWFVKARDYAGTSSRGIGPFFSAISLLREMGELEEARELSEEIELEALSDGRLVQLLRVRTQVLSELERDEEALALLQMALEFEELDEDVLESIREIQAALLEEESDEEAEEEDDE